MHFQNKMQIFTVSRNGGNRSGTEKVKIVSVLCALSLILADVDASGCRRRFTRQVINYKDCLPKRILTRACVGSCVTHAHLSETNPFKITHTCYQCKEAVSKQRKVKVLCPNPAGPAPFKGEVITVHVPQECQCEACTFEDMIGVVPAKSKE